MTIIVDQPVETFDVEEHAVTTTKNKEVVLNLSTLKTHGDLARRSRRAP
jgi:hypothetical protein